MHKLDFLVPCYNEGEEVVRPLLDSLALQVAIDFDDIGVIICCDGGSTVISGELMSSYPFDVEFHMCEHRGVSATRNACLDRSEAEYVCFCDCDDRLAMTCGLYTVMREIDTKDFQVMISAFYEQTKGPDGTFVFVTHGLNESTFVHGRAYNRKYLVDNGIRFSETLQIHEDSYHTILAQSLADPDKVLLNPTCWYLWTWRDQSICRSDSLYLKKTYVDMIKSSEALADEFISRMRDDLAQQYICWLVIDTYYTLLSKSWRDNINREYREKTERRFAQYLRKHIDRWNATPNEVKLAVSNGVRQRHVMEGDMMLEDITIEAWLARIQKRYG